MRCECGRVPSRAIPVRQRTRPARAAGCAAVVAVALGGGPQAADLHRVRARRWGDLCSHRNRRCIALADTGQGASRGRLLEAVREAQLSLSVCRSQKLRLWVVQMSKSDTREPRLGLRAMVGLSWVLGSPGREGLITERSRASIYVLYDCWHGLGGGETLLCLWGSEPTRVACRTMEPDSYASGRSFIICQC